MGRGTVFTAFSESRRNTWIRGSESKEFGEMQRPYLQVGLVQYCSYPAVAEESCVSRGSGGVASEVSIASCCAARGRSTGTSLRSEMSRRACCRRVVTMFSKRDGWKRTVEATVVFSSSLVFSLASTLALLRVCSRQCGSQRPPILAKMISPLDFWRAAHTFNLLSAILIKPSSKLCTSQANQPLGHSG